MKDEKGIMVCAIIYSKVLIKSTKKVFRLLSYFGNDLHLHNSEKKKIIVSPPPISDKIMKSRLGARKVKHRDLNL